MDGSSARYTYDATGRKLRAEYLKAGRQDTLRTDYCGNLIYEQGRPKMLLVDGGYVTFNDSLSFGEGWGGASYHYNLMDHLGNNRVVVNSNDSIEQINHNYYKSRQKIEYKFSDNIKRLFKERTIKK